LNQEEVIDSIGSRRQQIALEAEQVSISCIQTGDAPAAHSGDLVGHGKLSQVTAASRYFLTAGP
jgi:hypothetical protein